MLKTSDPLRRDVIMLVQLLHLTAIGPDQADVMPPPPCGSSSVAPFSSKPLQATVRCCSDARLYGVP